MTKRALSFNPNHIFVDTNVLVGGYSGDAKFQKDDDCLRYLFSLTGKRLYISSLSVAQLISVYQKKKSNEEITQVVRDLQYHFTSSTSPPRTLTRLSKRRVPTSRTMCSSSWQRSRSATSL